MNRLTRRLRRFLLTLWLALALTSAGASQSSLHAQAPNGAGLVIRHSDGRIVTAYVTFEEPAITGIELLQRAGIPVTVAPFGGLGLAVCAIADEGCPAEDCFCKAKQQPAWFWHYYGLTPDGRWVLHPVGASSRLVRDGDVDGWSWTAGESGLPTLTIDDIARAHGVERKAAATPTLVPSSPARPTESPPTAALPTPTPPPIPTPTVRAPGTPVPSSVWAPTPTSPAPPSPTPTATGRIVITSLAQEATPTVTESLLTASAVPTPSPSSSGSTRTSDHPIRPEALILLGLGLLVVALVAARRLHRNSP